MNPVRPRSFVCIDGHTCGNPVRLIATGVPPLHGATMLERRADFVENHDWIREALMFEPRGHDMMSGGILMPPCDPAADVGILFVETSGCLPMCGHGAIGLVTLGLESGLIQPRTPGVALLDTPAGLVRAEFVWTGERVAKVKLVNVPSFLVAAAVRLEVPGMGPLTVDVAYGGNFYAIVEPQPGYAGLDRLSALDIIRLSPAVRAAADAAVAPEHPEDAAIAGVSHVMWTGAPTDASADARNAVFYGAKAIDRSPCGTGTSARMAQLAARGELRKGAVFRHQSIIGSIFEGRIEAMLTIGGRPAIRPSITGWARRTGHNTLLVDPADPYWRGLTVL